MHSNRRLWTHRTLIFGRILRVKSSSRCLACAAFAIDVFCLPYCDTSHPPNAIQPTCFPLPSADNCSPTQTTKRKFAVAKESPPAPRAVAAGSYLQSSFSPAARAPSASPPPRLPSADFAAVPVLAAADQTLGSESEVPEVESAEAEQQAGKEETLPLVQSVNPPEIKETVKERLMRLEQASSSAASRLPASQRPTKAAHKHAQLFENQ